LGAITKEGSNHKKSNRRRIASDCI
jgi:hypothetical protein